MAELIEAVALLRRRRPDVRLRLVNADYGSGMSDAETARCRAAAERLGLNDVIEWETRFLDDEDSLALLAACDVIVTPTQASLESSSAAVRMALVAGAPVLVTPVSLFDDVGGAVVRAGGTTPAALAAALDRLLGDPAALDAARLASRAWAESNAWEDVSARFQGMLSGLCNITAVVIR